MKFNAEESINNIYAELKATTGADDTTIYRTIAIATRELLDATFIGLSSCLEHKRVGCSECQETHESTVAQTQADGYAE
jgi:hypothetical protein